jgi:uncharacterized membrane protein
LSKNDKNHPNDHFDELSDEEKLEALIASLEDHKKSEDEEEAAKNPKKEVTQKEVLKKPKKSIQETKNDKEPLKKQGTKKGKNNRLIMIKIGGAFHANFFINFILTYFINLTLIMTLMTLLFLGSFPAALWVPLTFTFVYSLSEFLFRELIMLNYTSLVIKSFGTLLYFGYVILFYLIDQFVFSFHQIFNGEAEVAAFTGIFMIVRYLSTYVVKKGLEIKL